MSKLSFRARALDAAKPLPVYRSRDLQDLTDCLSVCRTVPQMPTGMDKEEELVRTHLSQFFPAGHTAMQTGSRLVLPPLFLLLCAVSVASARLALVTPDVVVVATGTRV